MSQSPEITLHWQILMNMVTYKKNLPILLQLILSVSVFSLSLDSRMFKIKKS
jgi:hypothetical protein